MLLRVRHGVIIKLRDSNDANASPSNTRRDSMLLRSKTLTMYSSGEHKKDIELLSIFC